MKAGWPLTVKTFRIQRDARLGIGALRITWSRRIYRAGSGRSIDCCSGHERYLHIRSDEAAHDTGRGPKALKIIVKHLGKYSLTSLTPEVLPAFVKCVEPVRTAKVTTEIEAKNKQHRPTRSCFNWSHVDDCDQGMGRNASCEPSHEYPPSCSRRGEELAVYQRMRRSVY